MDSGTDFPTDVISAIHAGRKIDAIKRLREVRGIGLKDSKHAVDAYIRANPSLIQQQSGSGGLLLIVMLLVAGYLAYRFWKYQ